MPKVSIITPIYNSEVYLIDCINTVRNQNFLDYEHIIINDCSTDGTKQILNKYLSDKNIIFIDLKENIGPARARNIGIKAAKGEYISFLDVDDLWSNDKLSSQYQFMSNNNLFISYTDYFNLSGLTLRNKVIVPSNVNFVKLHKTRYVVCSSVMIINDENFFQELSIDLNAEDFLLWAYIIKKYDTQIYRTPSAYTIYRIVKGSRSSKFYFNGFKIFYLYWKIENISFFKSLVYFINYVFFSIIKKLIFQWRT